MLKGLLRSIFILITAVLMFQNCGQNGFEQSRSIDPYYFAREYSMSPSMLESVIFSSETEILSQVNSNKISFLSEQFSAVLVLEKINDNVAYEYDQDIFWINNGDMGVQEGYLSMNTRENKIKLTQSASPEVKVESSFYVNTDKFIVAMSSGEKIGDGSFVLNGTFKTFQNNTNDPWKLVERRMFFNQSAVKIKDLVVLSKASDFELKGLMSYFSIKHNIPIVFIDENINRVQISYQQVEPIIESKCFQCHEGSHDLKWSDAKFNPNSVAENIANGSMPKAGSPQLTNSERKLILDWVLGGGKRE